MRRLVLVPLVHDEADMGTAGPVLLSETVSLAGPERWAGHVDTLTRYWTEVSAFLGRSDPSRLALYQDGLPVGGSMGRSVVEEASRRGSRNYRLLLELIDRGAQLRRTEDPELLRLEYDLVPQETSTARLTGDKRDEQRTAPDPEKRALLLRERDEFIARTIDATLKEGEVGVLFLGAEHQATARLAPDIIVQPLKDPLLVRAYFRALLTPGHDRERMRLASYLAAPIAVDATWNGAGGIPAV